MIDPPTEPTFNDRWQAESDATWGDRPGIVASLLRYRVIVVAATLLGAVAGYGLADQLPVRYQAEAVLILSDLAARASSAAATPGERDREVYLAKQADIMTSRVVLERALELLGSDQSLPDVRATSTCRPRRTMASISIVATGADPRSAAALANAVGTAYEQVTEERVAADAQRAIASLEKLRNRLQAEPRRQPGVAGRPADLPSAGAAPARSPISSSASRTSPSRRRCTPPGWSTSSRPSRPPPHRSPSPSWPRRWAGCSACSRRGRGRGGRHATSARRAGATPAGSSGRRCSARCRGCAPRR